MSCRGLLVLATAWLTGCAVGPEYQRPEVDAPPEFAAQEVLNTLASDEQRTAYAADWWRGFSDSTLDRLVASGLEHNFRIAAATARVQQARAQVEAADAGDNLSASAEVDASAQHQQELDGGSSSTNSGLLGRLGATLPLNLFGRTTLNVRLARARLEANSAELRGTVLDVSAEITREYLRLRGNQRQLALLEESVALQEKTLAIVRSRFDAGLSPELDLRRAETSVENLRAQIPPLREALINSRNRLATLTGRFPGAYQALLEEDRSIPAYAGGIKTAMPLDVLDSRPDVRTAEAELKQAIAAIGVAETDYYPAFQLTSQISIGSSPAGSGPSTNLLIGSIGALIEQMITDGGARRANVSAAKARADEALAQYHQTLREAIEEVENTLAAIQASRQRQDSLEKAVDSSSRSFRQAENLYQLGLISFLDVVDAQRVLANAEQQLAAERTQYATLIATLFRVLGSGSDTPSESRSL